MSGTMMDVFNGDAFSSVTLTTLVNDNSPYVPMFLSNLGLALAQGMLTAAAAFEDVSGGLRLIPSSPRGAPPSQKEHARGRLRYLPALHFAREVEITADELLGARARGGNVAKTMQDLIRERVDGPLGLRQEWALTLEHMLLGAIDGVVYDADNSTVLTDFYDWTGTSRPTAVNFPFSTATADSGVIVGAAMALKRQMIKALNGMSTASAQIVVLCGDNFFDALLTSKEVVSARKTGALGNQQAAELISENTPYAALQYGGITWVNYRGTDDGSTVTVPTDEARAFMRGVPGLFQTLYAPADTFETVSTIGLPLYMLRLPERQTSKLAVWELQSNPVIACLRPQSLVRLTKS